MSTRTVIYARVSTEDQLEKYGLPVQIRACREYAAKNGLTVIGEPITDDGVSGVILDRPGLDRVRRMARDRQADVVLMLDVDRLSRELAHLLILKPEIERTARLEFVAAKFEDSPSGRLFFGIRGVIGQYERELTRERTMRGKKERARAGLIVGGRVPYGYLYDSGRLLEDPERAPITRRIYAEYEAGSSMRGIARMLRESGYPTWGGGKWGKSSVHRILLNETYAGVAHYGTLRREGKLLRRRETQDSISLIVPALVSREQWERVQGRLSSNSYIGRPTSRYLMRGVLYCSCGKRMGGETSKGRRVYRCTGRDPLRVKGALCRNIALMDPLDSAAWGALSKTFTDVSFLRETMAQQQAEQRNVQPAQIDELRRRASKLRRKEESIIALLIDPDMSDQRFRLKVECKATSEERRQIEQQLANVERSSQPGGAEWLDEAVRVIRGFVKDAEPESKQQFVRRLMQRAEWNGEEIRMDCFISQELAITSERCGQFDGLQVVVTARVAA